MLDSPRMGVKAIGCVVSTEFRGRLQAQCGQAQAAHAQARADRILRILAAMDSAGAMELRDTTYGLLAAASVEMQVSKATVSRDFALVRRIHRQFGRMFGRNFNPTSDKIFWSWDW